METQSEAQLGVKQWETRINKWERGIDPKKATNAELQEYIQTKVYQYTLDKMSDDNLWDLFQDNFKDFNIQSNTQKRATPTSILPSMWWYFCSTQHQANYDFADTC